MPRQHGSEAVDRTEQEIRRLCCNGHHVFQLILDCFLCFAQFVFVLQSHPELHGSSKYLGQTQCSIRSDTAFTQHDLVNAARWHTDRLSQPGLADFHWTQELFEEYLAGVNVL